VLPDLNKRKEEPKARVTGHEEGDAVAKAFEQEYEDSHPDGPYPPVELKPRPESKP
jgi:hypothetical protein